MVISEEKLVDRSRESAEVVVVMKAGSGMSEMLNQLPCEFSLLRSTETDCEARFVLLIIEKHYISISDQCTRYLIDDDFFRSSSLNHPRRQLRRYDWLRQSLAESNLRPQISPLQPAGALTVTPTVLTSDQNCSVTQNAMSKLNKGFSCGLVPSVVLSEMLNTMTPRQEQW